MANAVCQLSQVTDDIFMVRWQFRDTTKVFLDMVSICFNSV